MKGLAFKLNMAHLHNRNESRYARLHCPYQANYIDIPGDETVLTPTDRRYYNFDTEVDDDGEIMELI